LQDAVDANDITEEKLQHSFDIPNLPDVDLLIRTGGEMRISNFLLWHAAYAEFLFTDTLWPDYNCEEFLEDIEKFQKRTRRFGGVV
ncbi:MAG: undecaprenyl diphosphate synthase family protein, partial [Treponemataceae bacterium]|nr:undecaprenyl diphosphate synthase family protein [Treponemataceae bacterium]